MLAGELYSAQAPELRRDFMRPHKLTRMFNETTEEDSGHRTEILKQLFGYVGKEVYIEPPFRCDYGFNIYAGDHFYANYDCIILDVCRVNIGENVLFGPRVCLYTATHPIDPEIRRSGLEYGKPVTIGDNVWIGGNVVINPGVTIGNDTVIGSGSVVTGDIPGGVIAAGNPCRILKKVFE